MQIIGHKFKKQQGVRIAWHMLRSKTFCIELLNGQPEAEG